MEARGTAANAVAAARKEVEAAAEGKGSRPPSATAKVALTNKGLFVIKPPVLHPLAELGVSRLDNERERLLKHNKHLNKFKQQTFERSIAINVRKTEALERSLAAQQRVASVIAKRNQLESEIASKDKSMNALMEAKLAGPRAVMQMVWKQMFYRTVATALSNWIAQVKAAKDPRVRRLYLLGKIGKARAMRMQEMMCESVWNSFKDQYTQGYYKMWLQSFAREVFNPFQGAEERSDVYYPARLRKTEGRRKMPEWAHELRKEMSQGEEEHELTAAEVAAERRARMRAIAAGEEDPATKEAEVPKGAAPVETKVQLSLEEERLRNTVRDQDRKGIMRFWVALRKAKKTLREKENPGLRLTIQQLRDVQHARQLAQHIKAEEKAVAIWAAADATFNDAKNSLGDTMLESLELALERAREIQREEEEARQAEKVRNKEMAEMYAAKDDLIATRIEFNAVMKEYNETLEENDGDDKSPAMVVLKADLDEVRVRVEECEENYKKELAEAEEAQAAYDKELQEAEDARREEEQRKEREMAKEQAEAQLAGRSMDKEVKEMRQAKEIRDATKAEFDEATLEESRARAKAEKELAEAQVAEGPHAHRELEEAEVAMQNLKAPVKRLELATAKYNEAEAAYQKELAEAEEAQADAAREKQESEDLIKITDSKLDLDKKLKLKDAAVRARTRCEAEYVKQTTAAAALVKSEAGLEQIFFSSKEIESEKKAAAKAVADKEDGAEARLAEAEEFIAKVRLQKTEYEAQLAEQQTILRGRRPRKRAKKSKRAARRSRNAAAKAHRLRAAEEEKLMEEARERSGLNARREEDKQVSAALSKRR